MNTEPRVSVQIVVYNGERFIRYCLNALGRQTYRNYEVVVLDNASTDATAEIVAREYPSVRLIRSDRNLGMWPGQEQLMAFSTGEFICSLSVDVILDADFIAQSVRAICGHPDIGAVQGKLYRYALGELEARGLVALARTVIDTCGFALTRGRKVVNIGHGESDGTAFETARDIFGVEGAVPFFRRSALDDCRIDGHLTDPDYFWYGDDLDLAWRMTLFGHRQVFAPAAIAWHDRSTTKGSSRVPIVGQLKRVAIRKAIPLQKRRWDWSNTRFTIIKNDSIINILKDAPYILAREIAVFGYTVLFEPSVMLELGRFIRLLPRMLRRRRQVMRRARVSSSVMHQWYL